MISNVIHHIHKSVSYSVSVLITSISLLGPFVANTNKMYICKLFLYISYLGQIVHVYKQDLHLVPTMVRKLLSTGYQQYVWERMCPSHLLSEFIPFSSHCVLSAKMVVSSFHTFFCKQNIGNRNKRRTGYYLSSIPITNKLSVPWCFLVHVYIQNFEWDEGWISPFIFKMWTKYFYTLPQILASFNKAVVV